MGQIVVNDFNRFSGKVENPGNFIGKRGVIFSKLKKWHLAAGRP